MNIYYICILYKIIYEQTNGYDILFNANLTFLKNNLNTYLFFENIYTLIKNEFHYF